MGEPAVPSRNVELKARDPDPQRSLRLALAAGAQQAGMLEQTDTYFHAAHGRLKLREQTGSEGRRAWLIPYERADESSARQSSYRLVPVERPEGMKEALTGALGVLVVVRKRRELLLWRGVRIHLDRVDGLGAFIEIEAVADEHSDLTGEHRLVTELMEMLKIDPSQIVSFSYSDALMGSTLQP